jgi:hypothetical protein
MRFFYKTLVTMFIFSLQLSSPHKPYSLHHSSTGGCDSGRSVEIAQDHVKWPDLVLTALNLLDSTTREL